MSSFTWLDYSDRDKREMLEVVDLFRQKDTRDELGVGSVRDAFADLLFPGTSTVMTRARYYLLVPWTYLRLEEKRVSAATFEARARGAELELIDVIARSEDNAGNLGRIAGRALKRLPSSVYWQGLGAWGIRTFEGSLTQYHRGIDEFYRRTERHQTRTRDDEDSEEPGPTNWHAGLVAPNDGFPRETSLALSAKEADYLAERIQLSPRTQNSLLSVLLSKRAKVEAISFVWEHPDLGSLPHKLRLQVLHAQNFSEVIHGAALLYNRILAEQTRRKDAIEEFGVAYHEWTELVRARSSSLQTWNRSEFWDIVAITNPGVHPRTRAFIDNWSDLVFSGKCADIEKAREARELITQREQFLKRNLARIGKPDAEHDWSGSSGAGRLDFRWEKARGVLTDIFGGMGER